jgi:hypothetical protein
MESETYGDIVQTAFEDTYRNLTYKAMSVLRWVSTYCPSVTYVLKADDDAIVNAFTIQWLLESPGLNLHQIACCSFTNYTVL